MLEGRLGERQSSADSAAPVTEVDDISDAPGVPVGESASGMASVVASQSVPAAPVTALNLTRMP